MENASKALIIAGAILISILLISVAILVINATNGVNEGMESEMDSMAIRTFNDKFTAYEGTDISANQVKGLISLVNSSNASNDVSAGQEKFVQVTGITSATQVSHNKKYTVVLTYGAGGYVSVIDISETP